MTQIEKLMSRHYTFFVFFSDIKAFGEQITEVKVSEIVFRRYRG